MGMDERGGQCKGGKGSGVVEGENEVHECGSKFGTGAGSMGAADSESTMVRKREDFRGYVESLAATNGFGV